MVGSKVDMGQADLVSKLTTWCVGLKVFLEGQSGLCTYAENIQAIPLLKPLLGPPGPMAYTPNTK